jgi:hypothetical protein
MRPRGKGCIAIEVGGWSGAVCCTRRRRLHVGLGCGEDGGLIVGKIEGCFCKNMTHDDR